MLAPAVRDQQDARVGVLFSPDTVVVIDIFRALGNFEEHYDVAALDWTERRLASFMPQEVAKGIVSDALLLAFGVRREPGRWNSGRLSPAAAAWTSIASSRYSPQPFGTTSFLRPKPLAPSASATRSG